MRPVVLENAIVMVSFGSVKTATRPSTVILLLKVAPRSSLALQVRLWISWMLTILPATGDASRMIIDVLGLSTLDVKQMPQLSHQLMLLLFAMR